MKFLYCVRVAMPTADPGDASSIQAQSHTFVEIDHEIITTVILPSVDSRRFVVSCKRSQACPGKSVVR